ncbi:MAG: site-2 protease family protein [Chloroflexi bacterium]|nr:site-2 protease family protein [Chloroflexota bacterium]
MGRSFKIWAIRGIDIRIHITFPIILFWAAFQYGQLGGMEGAVLGLALILFLFVLVTLHELGHSFAALHYGVPVRQIVLLPIGGLAQLDRMPEKPIQEFVVAVAGPAVNVILMLLMWLVGLALGLPFVNPLGSFDFSFETLFAYLFVYNGMLALFNMLPAFPMDGGRVLRALLAMVMSYERATAVAVNIGRAVAVALGLYGLINGAFFMMLIAIFIFIAGTQELTMVRWRGRLSRSGYGFSVQQAYSTQVGVLGPYDSVRQALTEQMRGLQTDFPVAEDGRYLGFVTEDGLLRAANLYGPDTLIYAAMSLDVRPVALQTDLLDVQRQMSRLRVRALPVAEYGRLLGMITYRQIQTFIQQRSVWPKNDRPRVVGA